MDGWTRFFPQTLCTIKRQHSQGHWLGMIRGTLLSLTLLRHVEYKLWNHGVVTFTTSLILILSTNTKCDFHGLWLDEVAGWRDGGGVVESGRGSCGWTLEVRMPGPWTEQKRKSHVDQNDKLNMTRCKSTRCRRTKQAPSRRRAPIFNCYGWIGTFFSVAGRQCSCWVLVVVALCGACRSWKYVLGSACTGCAVSIGSSKFRTLLFSMCFRHPDYIFPRNSRMNEGGGEIRGKNIKFQTPLDQKWHPL